MAENKTFYSSDGNTFSTLKAFTRNLQTMDEDTFTSHVNEEKNDFANWMQFALKEEKLAKKVEELKSKDKIELEVLRHLVHNVKKKIAKAAIPKKN